MIHTCIHIYTYIYIYICYALPSEVLLAEMESQSQHIVYLTSSSCKDIFPLNTSHAFENSIQTLHLDPALHYEVGMANILLPASYYILRENEPDQCIKIRAARTLHMFTPEDDFSRSAFTNHEEICLPSVSVLGPEKSIAPVLSAANSMVIPSLLRAINFCYGRDSSLAELNNIQNDFFEETPIKMAESGKCSITRRTISDSRIIGNQCCVTMTFSHGMARMLGFVPEHPYVIFEIHKNFSSIDSYYLGNDVHSYYPDKPPAGNDGLYVHNTKTSHADNMPRTDGGVDYLFVYSDLCTRSRFGSRMVNILGAFAMGNSTSLGFNPTVYHQINSHKISTIAIRIADQDGIPIVFDPSRTVTLALHLRPK